MTTTTNHLTPAELDTLLEAAKAATPELAIVARLGAAEYGIANPGTITRLVLMVRELQQENEQLRLPIRAQATTETIVKQSVEHFRARAVRAIDKERQEAPLVQAATWSDAKLLIKSLPLVETEDE